MFEKHFPCLRETYSSIFSSCRMEHWMERRIGMNFGKKIKELRLQKTVTQEQFAAYLNINQPLREITRLQKEKQT